MLIFDNPYVYLLEVKSFSFGVPFLSEKAIELSKNNIFSSQKIHKNKGAQLNKKVRILFKHTEIHETNKLNYF